MDSSDEGNSGVAALPTIITAASMSPTESRGVASSHPLREGKDTNSTGEFPRRYLSPYLALVPRNVGPLIPLTNPTELGTCSRHSG